MIDLADYPLTLIFAVSVVVILAASEIGRRYGVRVVARSGDNVSTLEGALLGLLSLLIGFTFAMALARFEARRDALLDDANAIGTTALRARLLPQPYSTKSLNLWTHREGRQKPITLVDIIIITQYTMHSCFKFNDGCQARETVDKFQGQEAPIAIYSTATSSRQASPDKGVFTACVWYGFVDEPNLLRALGAHP